MRDTTSSFQFGFYFRKRSHAKLGIYWVVCTQKLRTAAIEIPDNFQGVPSCEKPPVVSLYALLLPKMGVTMTLRDSVSQIYKEFFRTFSREVIPV